MIYARREPYSNYRKQVLDKVTFQSLETTCRTRYTTYGGANSTDYTTGTSIGSGIATFSDGIFGTDINATSAAFMPNRLDAEARLLSFNTDEQMIDRAADILNNAEPLTLIVATRNIAHLVINDSTIKPRFTRRANPNRNAKLR
jgi:hypothetical protein